MVEMEVINDTLYFDDFDFNNLKAIPALFNFVSENKIVKAPANIIQKNLYLRGFKLYCQACTLTNIKEEDLTEEILFYMAVVAYDWRNLTPLTYLCNHLNLIEDKCYWLWLAKHEELFNNTMNVELVRRGILDEDKLRIIELNIDHEVELKISDKPEGFIKPEPQLLVNQERWLKFQDMYFVTEFDTFNYNYPVEEILDYEGTVVSGTPLNYRAQPAIKLSNPKLVQDRELLWTLQQIQELHGDDHNLHELNKMLDQDDIKTHIREDYKDEVVEQNGEFYLNLNMLNRPMIEHEIDVYFYEVPEIKPVNTMLDIIDMMISRFTDSRVYHRENMVTLYLSIKDDLLFDRSRCLYKVNFIKQCYKTPKQVLVNIDLDSQRYIMYKRGDELGVLATPAYLKAVEYGINPIVPSRLTKLSNARLLDLRVQGYEPWLPFNTDETVVRSVSGTYGELLICYDQQLKALDYDLDVEEIKDQELTIEAIFNLYKLNVKLKEDTNFYVNSYEEIPEGMFERDEVISRLLGSRFWNEQVLDTDYLAGFKHQVIEPIVSCLTKILGVFPEEVILYVSTFFVTRQSRIKYVYTKLLNYHNEDSEAMLQQIQHNQDEEDQD